MMILNLPARFPLTKLEQVVIGDADGGDDSLLEACACKLSPMQEFLAERKQIIVGERGTGKTALAKLLSEKKLQFANPGNLRQLLVVIDDEIDYRGIREHLRERGKSGGVDKSLAYRMIWEIFILFRLINYLSVNAPNNRDFLGIKERFQAAVGLDDEKPTLFELLFKQKKTFGVKVDNLSAPTPSLAPFFSLEPTHSESDKNEGRYLDIQSFKQEISGLLAAGNAVVYIIADRLDEFVVGEDYNTQRLVLEGMLECHRGYSAFKRVYLRPFLRYDLFQRISFEKLGAEKVRSKTVELRWGASDIREFIAKRLAYNYFDLFDVDRLEFSVNRANLSLSRMALSETSLEMRETPLWDQFEARFWDSVIGRGLSFSLARLGLHVRKGRIRYLNDEINRQIIFVVFPESFVLINSQGGSENISLLSFLETHFNFGNGFCTPRTFILFLEKCFERARNYYRLNPDLAVPLTQKSKTYPLFNDEMISEAYVAIQRISWESVINVSQEWAPLASRFRQERGAMVVFEFETVRQLLKIDKDKCQHFCAFAVHIGLLHCHNPAARHADRSYELPKLFIM